MSALLDNELAGLGPDQRGPAGPQGPNAGSVPQSMGQQVYVENKPGAGAMIGVEMAADSAPEREAKALRFERHRP